MLLKLAILSNQPEKEKGFNCLKPFLDVPQEGIEPPRLSALDFESSASTNSATKASLKQTANLNQKSIFQNANANKLYKPIPAVNKYAL